jgi:hypothetical protein
MEKLPENLLLSFAESLSISDIDLSVFPLKLKFSKVLKTNHPISLVKQPKTSIRTLVELISETFTDLQIQELLAMIEKDIRQKVSFLTSYNKFNTKNNLSDLLYFKFEDERELYLEEIEKDIKKEVM